MTQWPSTQSDANAPRGVVGVVWFIGSSVRGGSPDGGAPAVAVVLIAVVGALVGLLAIGLLLRLVEVVGHVVQGIPDYSSPVW